MKLTIEDLKEKTDLFGTFEIDVVLGSSKINLLLDPDDATISETINLANKILANFEFYETNALKIIVEEFLDTYNEDWSEEEKPLSETAFKEKLNLGSIGFLSRDCIDFFYNESEMFGGSFLTAQSYDGESFESAMLGG